MDENITNGEEEQQPGVDPIVTELGDYSTYAIIGSVCGVLLIAAIVVVYMRVTYRGCFMKDLYEKEGTDSTYQLNIVGSSCIKESD